MGVCQSRNDQAQIDQIKLDRIEPFTRLGQDVETVFEMASGCVHVAGDCRFRRRDCLPPQMPVVESLEMMHAPTEQFYEDLADPQRVEVSDQFFVQGAQRTQRIQNSLGQRAAIGEADDNVCPGGACLVDPIDGEDVLRSGRNEDQRIVG
jgi:hypothetical protein